MSDQLLAVFAEEFGMEPAELNDDSSPDSVDAWDSLAAMRLVAAIEETFKVTLSTTDIMKMRSIGKARSVLQRMGVAV
jgi:acyl carrier protein